MIKETCSCGASFEVNQGYTEREKEAVTLWRVSHLHTLPEKKHWGDTYVGPSKPEYVLNEDYIYNEFNEPVWISNIRNPPLFWWHHVPAQKMDVKDS